MRDFYLIFYFISKRFCFVLVNVKIVVEHKTIGVVSLAGRKKKSKVESEVAVLAKNFFTVKTWQRKDVSTNLAKKMFGISPTRVFRLLKALGVNYQTEPFSDGLSLEDKIEYLLKNLRAYEVVAFYEWYNDIKNKKAPKKATYNLSPEGKMKILEKQIQRRERNKELMAKMNNMSALIEKDAEKKPVPMISEIEKARLSSMTLNIFAKSMIAEIRDASATEKKKIELIDKVLPSIKKTIEIANASTTSLSEQLKLVVAKIAFYYEIKKLTDKDLLVKGQAKSMEVPITIFDREWEKQERKARK